MYKKIIVFLTVLLIAATTPAAKNSVYAQTETKLYNCGNEVKLLNNLYIYNNKYYICFDDLKQINLDYSDNVIFNDENKLELNYGSSIVILNNNTVYFAEPSVELDTGRYVSVDLIVTAFSKDYKQDGNSLYLWIKPYKDYFNIIRGVISLPNGEKAPAGGVKVNVYAGARVYASSVSGGGGLSGGSASKPSYIGIIPAIQRKTDKPDYSKKFSNTGGTKYIIKKIAETEITIDEGQSNAEYVLTTAKEFKAGYYVAYTVNYNGCSVTNALRIAPGKLTYDFVIDENIGYIRGKITIPSAVSYDTEFDIAAQECSQYGSIYGSTVTVKAGETYAPYLIKVYKNKEYNVFAVSKSGEYMRTDKEPVYVSLTDKNTADNINIFTEKSNAVSVKLTLPDDVTLDEDLYVKVYMQGIKSPYYTESETVIIKSGEKSAECKLYDDMDMTVKIFGYIIENKNDILYDFGHYAKGGTTCNAENAQIIVENADNITIPMLKASFINAKINLPDNETAQNDLYILAYPYIDSAQYTSLNRAKTYAASENTNSEKTSGGGGSGSGSVSDAKIPVIVKGANCGYLNIKIPQESNIKFKLQFAVYDKFNNYTSHIYYKDNSNTTEFESADFVDCKTGEISLMLKKVNRVEPCRVYADKTPNGGLQFDVFNFGGKKINDVSVMLCFYRGEKLTKTFLNNIDEIDKKEYKSVYFENISEYLENADTVKFFVMSGLRPHCEITYVKDNNTMRVPAKMYADVFLKTDDSNMYCRGEKINLNVLPAIYSEHIYVPLRAVAEAFECEVSFDCDTQNIVIKNNGDVISVFVDSNTGYYNGEQYQFNNAPKMLENGYVLVDFCEIAAFFGYNVNENFLNGTISFYK